MATNFIKRAARFMVGLFSSLNGETFTNVEDIESAEVQNTAHEDFERTVKIFEDMQYVEVTRDDLGLVTSLRLTPSGVAHTETIVKDLS